MSGNGGSSSSDRAKRSERFVGIELSPEKIDVVVRPTGERWSIKTGETGMVKLIDRLRDVDPEIVVMPQRGRLELPVARDLVAAGIRCALVPPMQIRNFARAINRFRYLADGEAEMLARFAELVRPEEYSISEDGVRRLRDLKQRRRELLAMITAEESRLRDRTATVRKDIRNHLEHLEKALRQLDDEANAAIRSSAIWK